MTAAKTAESNDQASQFLAHQTLDAAGRAGRFVRWTAATHRWSGTSRIFATRHSGEILSKVEPRLLFYRTLPNDGPVVRRTARRVVLFFLVPKTPSPGVQVLHICRGSRRVVAFVRHVTDGDRLRISRR